MRSVASSQFVLNQRVHAKGLLMTTASRILQFVRRIGSCPTCMHEAFLAALAAWGITAVAGLAGIFLGTTTLAMVTGAIAAALTLLWILHLIAYTIRAVFGGEAEDGSVPVVFQDSLGRRAFIGRFASIFVGAAL